MVDYDDLGWVRASDYREKALLSMANGPIAPKDIAREYDYYLSHVSNTLSDLEDRDLIVCKTPDRHKGRIYETTEKGDEIIEFLNPE